MGQSRQNELHTTTLSTHSPSLVSSNLYSPLAPIADNESDESGQDGEEFRTGSQQLVGTVEGSVAQGETSPKANATTLGPRNRRVVRLSLDSVTHDSSDLFMVTAEIDGRRCRDVLVDPGASSNFVRRSWVVQHQLPEQQLQRPVEVSLADGRVVGYQIGVVEVKSARTNGSVAPCSLLVMDTLSHDVILGMPWLRRAKVLLGCNDELTWNGKPLHPVTVRTCSGKPRAVLQVISVKTGSGHEQTMAALLRRHETVFRKDLPRRHPDEMKGAFHYQLTLVDPDCRPVRQRERRRSPQEVQTLMDATREMEKAGLIENSISPWGAQAVLVSKKRDGVVLPEKRPCWDYRLVNDRTVADAQQPPLPEMMFDHLKGARVFSKLDLLKGFWQIPLEKRTREVLAFSTPLGLKQPLFMPFGIKNAPAAFQREMQRVFADRLYKGVMVFIDDILIYSKTAEQHRELVDWVLRRLKEEGYYAHPDKCEFFMPEVSFLGHVVSEKGVAVQQYKVEAVERWPIPQTKKQVRGFLGLAGYYRKFVPEYSRIALPLTDLTKDDVALVWGNAQQHAFDELKRRLTSAPVLAHPNPAQQYILNTDASGFAISGVLSQQQDDGTIRPVAYWSRKMDDPETRYHPTEQELLAIVKAVEHWRCYLEGSPHPLILRSDHKSLTYLDTKQELSSRLYRWLMELAPYEWTVEYVPGEKNAAADALSRRVDLEEDVTAARPHERPLNRPRLRLKTQADQATVAATSLLPLTQVEGTPGNVSEVHTTLLNELQRAALQDEDYQRELQRTDDGRVRSGGLMWTTGGQVYVPNDRAIQLKLIREAHDAAGHQASKKTRLRLQQVCWWATMRRDVEDYCQSCVGCAATKHSPQLPAGKLQPLPIPSEPWETISIDFVGPLPMTEDGKNSILVIVDKFTKMAHFIATTTEATAKTVARLVMAQIVCKHGRRPERIISDRDPRFVSGVWQELWKAMGAQLKMSTAYHPQTDGQTEIVNRWLMTALRVYGDKEKDKWQDNLALVEAAYNSTVHSSTGKTPFEMNGIVFRSNTQLALTMPNMTGVSRVGAEELLSDMRRVWEEARAEMIKARDRQKRYADKSRRDETYAIGDQVMLSTKDLSTHRTKMSDPYIGPFRVTEVLPGGVTVRLSLPQQYDRLHNGFHVSRLKRYRPATIDWPGRQQLDRPLPELVDGQLEYEVEAILGKRETEEWVTIEPMEPPEEPAGNPLLPEPSAADTTVTGTASPGTENDPPVRRRSPRILGKAVSQASAPAEAGRLARKKKSKRERRTVTRYLVKWKGFDESEATWQREDDLDNAREAVDEYERRQQEERGEATLAVLYNVTVQTAKDGRVDCQLLALNPQGTRQPVRSPTRVEVNHTTASPVALVRAQLQTIQTTRVGAAALGEDDVDDADEGTEVQTLSPIPPSLHQTRGRPSQTSDTTSVSSSETTSNTAARGWKATVTLRGGHRHSNTYRAHSPTELHRHKPLDLEESIRRRPATPQLNQELKLRAPPSLRIPRRSQHDPVPYHPSALVSEPTPIAHLEPCDGATRRQ